MVKSIFLVAASLTALASASSVFFVTHQTSNAATGRLSVQDQVLVFDGKKPGFGLCAKTPTPNMSCTATGPKDSSSCEGVYRGSNKSWDKGSIRGVFDLHNGNFLSGGRVIFPDHSYSIVQSDKRCAPYECQGTGSGKDDKTVYKGFSCQI